MSKTAKYASLILILVAGSLLAACDWGGDTKIIIQQPSSEGTGSDTANNVVKLPANRTKIERAAREALDNAQPGDTIVFPAGHYNFLGSGLTIDVSNVTLRGAGQGENGTVLDFSASDANVAAIIISSPGITIKDLAVLNPPTDGFRSQKASTGDGNASPGEGNASPGEIQFLNGITFKNVRVEWNKPPAKEHGAYGFYPVQAKNVLLDNITCIGSSDACVYVGQSKHIVVRNSVTSANVIGIEIESSTHVDVYDNETYHNAVGMVVYSIAGVPYDPEQADIRIYDNTIHDNNGVNFGSGFAGDAPAGTGLLVLSSNHVEIYNNKIHGNHGANLAFVYYGLLSTEFSKDFNPYVQAVYVHDNTIYDGGTQPVPAKQPPVENGSYGNAKLLKTIFGVSIPDIIWTRVVSPNTFSNIGGTNPANLKLCFQNNQSSGGGQVMYSDAYRGLIVNKPPIEAGTGIHDCDGSKLGLRTKKVQLPQFSGGQY